MRRSSYWFSWILTCNVLAILLSLVVTCSGFILQFELFINSEFFIMLALFYVFSMSMLMVGCMLSTVLTSVKTAYSATYGFIIVGLVMQVILSARNLQVLIYLETLDWWVDVILYVLYLYPPFNFCKILTDISAKACSTFDMKTTSWVKGPGFTYDDLFETVIGYFKGDKYVLPTTASAFGLLALDCLLYFILMLYFDYTNPSNTGKSYSPFFFLEPSFYSAKETEALLDEPRTEGLEVKEVSKTYSETNCFKTKEVHALDKVSFGIKQGKLFSLLGHNGAGKTTLINVLTGNHQATAGEVVCFNKKIEDTVKEGKIGVCPQHDILWEDLSAYEHLKIFSQIREVEGNLEEYIENALELVNLTEKKNVSVGLFSGGMKRRMSILLSTVGNPSLLILDEPTTGLDPVNKRFIWKMLTKIKQDKAVLLTTHSMDEADYLSDEIGIIKGGKIMCVGTGLSLKERYGDGYLLSFMVGIDDKDYALSLIKEVFPSSKIVNESGGSIILNLADKCKEELKIFVNFMNRKATTETEEKLLELIKEANLNYTTLEEVFLKVNDKGN